MSTSSLLEDPTSLSISVACVNLSTDERGKKCAPSQDRKKHVLFPNHDWVRLTILNVPNKQEVNESYTANGGIATDSDISRGRGG